MKAHQAFNRRDYDGAVGIMAQDLVYQDQARSTTYRGKDGFKAFLQETVAAFSDVQVSEPTYIDAGKAVIAQFINRGTNDGPAGALPATGKPVEVSLCEVLRFNDEGQVISGDLYYDQLSILVQMGHVPTPPNKSATA